MANETNGIGRTQCGSDIGIKQGAKESISTLIGEQNIPIAVKCNRWIGFLLTQDEIQRTTKWCHFGCIKSTLAVNRCVSCRRQQIVTSTRGNIQRLSEEQHHLPAG